MPEVTELSLNETEIVFFHSGNSKKYPVILLENKMVIVYDHGKMLLHLEYTGDTILQLTELYQKNPLKLMLKRNYDGHYR